DLRPPGARRLVVVERDGRVVMPGPGPHRRVPGGEAHRQVVEALDVEAALGAFGPRAWNAGGHHQAEAARRARLFELHEFQHRARSPATPMPAGGGAPRTRLRPL